MAWFAAPIILKGLAWGAGIAVSALVGSKTKDWVTEKLEQKTRDKVMAELKQHSTDYLTQLEQAWYRAFWRYFAIQNGVLLLALMLSFWLGTWLFYAGLVVIALWNGVLAYGFRAPLAEFMRHRSLKKLLQARLRQQLDAHLQTLTVFEQRWLEAFVAEQMDDICQHTAHHLYPRVRFALLNVALMLLLSFVVFRLAIVPLVD